MATKSGVALTGDWNRLRNFLRSGQEFVDGVNDVIKEEAEKLRDEVIGEIPYGTPNAPSTVRRKKMDAPLFEGGTLASEEGIVVREFTNASREFKKYYVVQGNPDKLVETPDGRNHDGMTYQGLLELMESGGGSIPSRPVLTITFDRFKSSLEREIIAKATVKIKEAIRGTG